MKSILIICILALSNIAISQTTIKQKITHTDDSGLSASGCTKVYLLVSYTLGGQTYNIKSKTVTLDANYSTILSVVIPSGATITGKTAKISTENYMLNYQITSQNNSENAVYPTNCCSASTGNVIHVVETPNLIEISFDLVTIG